MDRFLFWKKGSSIDSAKVIGVREGGLYRLLGQSAQALVHNDTNLCELWHCGFAHIHYKALSVLKNVVTGLPELQVQHEGVCIVHLARTPRDTFQAMATDPRKSWN